jgi:ABC-type lipoprotein release transport system permease subunit
MILRHAAALALAGVTAGLRLAAALQPVVARRVASAEIETNMSIDPAVASVTAAVALVLLAASLPARRAARIEPTLALKAQ